MKAYVALMIVALMAGCGKEQAPPAQAVTVQAVAAPSEKPADYMTIALKPDEFKAAFNAAAEANKSTFRVTSLDVKREPSGAQFQYQFDPNISVLGTINDYDGSIRSLIATALVVGTKESALNGLLIMHDLVRATNPALPEGDSGKIALNLFQQAAKQTGEKFEDVRNGIRYAAIFIQGAGVMFVIEQKR